MGLDMYIYKRPKLISTATEEEDLAYFRKHSDLHGYMEQLYYDKGGQEEIFNCVELLLSKNDLLILRCKVKKQIKGQDIFGASRGFFWGESIKEDWDNTLIILNSILEDTDFTKEQVCYNSWW